MRFYRNIRGPNCPNAVKEKFKAAMEEADPQTSKMKAQALFKEYQKCKEDWMQSDIMVEHSRSHSTRNRGVWKWITGIDT